MTLLRKYYDGLGDWPTGGGIPDEEGTCPHCGAPTKVTIHKSVKDPITGDVVECDWEEHTYKPFTVSIPDEVKSKSEEYATQMMGLGEYNEKWNYADKCMWETIAKSFRGGHSLASEELARLKEENERLRGEGWISVEDRLPIVDKTVLCLFKHGRMDVCKYTKVFEMEFVENAICVTTKITHWQPLPEPPSPTKK